MTTAMTTQSSGEHLIPLVSQLADGDASAKDPACCNLRASTLVSTAETRARADELVEDGAREHTDETIYETVARERAERDAGRPGRPCTDFPGCEEVDTHDDHSAPEFLVRSYDETKEPLVWACVSYLGDGTPYVGFNGEDLTPDQAREKAAELRKLPDALEAMADQADTWRALANLRQVRETADPAGAEIFDIMTDSIKEGADPGAVFEQVLGLFRQARAERAASRV